MVTKPHPAPQAVHGDERLLREMNRSTWISSALSIIAIAVAVAALVVAIRA